MPVYMKINIYLSFILFVVSCSNKENNQTLIQPSGNEIHEMDSSEVESEEVIERKLLKEFPDYSKVRVVKGKFDTDSLMDYLYILDSNKEKRNTSKCVLLLGNKKKNKQRKIVFDDLLPGIIMSGKIEEPFETIRLSYDTLFVCFVSSAYGHNELCKESYSFKYNTEKHFFTLVHFKYEVCILPECENTASITIAEDELLNCKLPFSFQNWLTSGGCFSSVNCSFSEKNISQWKRFSTELKQIGLDYKSKTIEDELF